MYDDYNNEPKIGLARKSARALINKSKIKCFPVLIKDIAKSIPELDVEGKELNDTISGVQIRYKDRDYVLYNTTQSSTRNRFTVAHEIGHALLGHTSSNGGENIITSSQEVEANQFAAELLMPLSLLKEAMKTYTTISDLARLCWVSNSAMSARVLEMNLYNFLTSWD